MPYQINALQVCLDREQIDHLKQDTSGEIVWYNPNLVGEPDLVAIYHSLKIYKKP